MYTRPPKRDASLRVPENYSGCAFSETERDLPPRYLEVAAPNREPPPPPPVRLPPPPRPMLLTGGLDFDQLLILGLILLLSREAGESDAVICLALLLLVS